MKHITLCVFFSITAGVGMILAQDIGQDEYVRVRDGYLFRRGKRLRLWGINIQGPTSAKDYSLIDANVERIKSMGFNAVRLWGAVLLRAQKWQTNLPHLQEGRPLPA